MQLSKFIKRPSSERLELKKFLKKFDKKTVDDLHQLVQKADAKVWANTNCLACANCCKKMTPIYLDSDVERIAQYLGMEVAEFNTRYTRIEDGTGDRININLPCDFLNEDNTCRIYEVRPEDCREFPHHHKQPFDEFNDTYQQNLDYCPATYDLVKSLKRRIEDKYIW